ncbi:MAG: hypothetical protein AB7F35_20975 [Acetobacteraceae bacterium]
MTTYDPERLGREADMLRQKAEQAEDADERAAYLLLAARIEEQIKRSLTLPPVADPNPRFRRRRTDVGTPPPSGKPD